MSENGKGNRNHQGRGNSRRNKEQRKNLKFQEQKDEDKNVPMKYESKQSKMTTSVLLKFKINGKEEKVQLTMFDEGPDKQFLKLVKEFKNLIETYDLWNGQEGAALVYRYFRRCITGSARDLWDRICEEEEEEQDELTFEAHLFELTSEILGADACQLQKDYLKKTRKPEKMSVKQWISRMRNINSYLPLMEQDAVVLTERELIAEVITPNLPKPWLTNFKLLELNRKTKIKDVLDKLVVMEENIKLEKKQSNQQGGNKLKKPCRLHNGTHEWSECRQNPKNGGGGNNQQKNGQDQKKGGNNNGNNRNREEQRNTEDDDNRNRGAQTRNRRTADYDDDEESLCMVENAEDTRKKVSAEVLIAIPIEKGSKKYTTYLGLLDTGCSSSLIDGDIIDETFEVQSVPKTKWKTQAGTFETKGKVQVDNYIFPQFTNKRKISSTFHMFQKRKGQ
jgi:hypothetical protein